MAETRLVGVFERPTVDTVVRCVEGTLGEPSDITGGEATRPDRFEGPVPVKRLAGDLQVAIRTSGDKRAPLTIQNLPAPTIYQSRGQQFVRGERGRRRYPGRRGAFLSPGRGEGRRDGGVLRCAYQPWQREGNAIESRFSLFRA